MAKISFDGLQKYAKEINALGGSVDKAAKYAVYPAAGYVRDQIKAATPVDEGDLRDSVSLEKFTVGEDEVYTKIFFDGYDRNHVPNALKANAIESGTSRMKKRPFIRPTVNRTKAEAQRIMSEKLDEYFDNLMGGK